MPTQCQWTQKTKNLHELNGKNIMADISMESGIYVLDIMMLPGLNMPCRYPLNTTAIKTAKKRATELMVEYLKVHKETTQDAINDITGALDAKE